MFAAGIRRSDTEISVAIRRPESRIASSPNALTSSTRERRWRIVQGSRRLRLVGDVGKIAALNQGGRCVPLVSAPLDRQVIDCAPS